MKEKKKKPTLCLVSSSGGHWEQLLCLKDLNSDYDCFWVTEKTKYNKKDNKINYFIKQVNRKEILFIPKMFIIAIQSLYILIKEKPDVIISTGVLACIPMMMMGHLLKKRIIYIESFAKISSPTLTGKLMYKYADRFYVQWKQMLEIYPNAIYKGGIY